MCIISFRLLSVCGHALPLNDSNVEMHFSGQMLQLCHICGNSSLLRKLLD
ncbi:Protein of unknown function [Gryllus bimaculatus]|nr:Protein of unknown function [Gryllus bimaculatus]